MAQKKSTKKTEDTKVKSQKLKGKTIKIAALVLLSAIALFFIYNNLLKENNNKVHYYKFIKEGELTFTDSTGKQLIKIDIEIADDEYQRQLGLMNRQSMDEMKGMIFIFPEERYQSFWMLNTLFSLDMLFINSNKEIVTIHKNTKPLSEQSYPSSKPSRYVLEVNAGFCERHNIREGDKVFWIGHTLSVPK